MPVVRLSREEAAIKYAPRGDPNWTNEMEAAFFQPWPTTTPPIRMSPTKRLLIKDYASNTLKAKRMSDKYINTLGSILGSFATADRVGGEALLPQRSEHHGEPRTIRTIQAQMLNAGVVVKEVRTQGLGFVGSVFVYSPQDPFRYRRATVEDLHASYRAAEQDCAQPRQLQKNIRPVDVPY